jgi:hypothetical protein
MHDKIAQLQIFQDEKPEYKMDMSKHKMLVLTFFAQQVLTVDPTTMMLTNLSREYFSVNNSSRF